MPFAESDIAAPDAGNPARAENRETVPVVQIGGQRKNWMLFRWNFAAHATTRDRRDRFVRIVSEKAIAAGVRVWREADWKLTRKHG